MRRHGVAAALARREHRLSDDRCASGRFLPSSRREFGCLVLTHFDPYDPDLSCQPVALLVLAAEAKKDTDVVISHTEETAGASQLRQCLLKAVERQKDQVMRGCGGQTVHERILAEGDFKSWADYREKLACSGGFIGVPELSVLAQMDELNLHIYVRHVERRTCCNLVCEFNYAPSSRSAMFRSPVRLLFTPGAAQGLDHYDLLLPHIQRTAPRHSDGSSRRRQRGSQ